MFHLTIFAANEGEISPSDFTSVTFLGACDLKRPTMAQRIMRLRSKRNRGTRWYERILGTSRGLILTIFGVTELHRPSLMEEYASMRSLISSGSMTPPELRQCLDRILAGGARDDWLTLTLFGVCCEGKFKLEAQLKALDAGCKTGLISDDHHRQLRDVIAAPVTTTAALLGRLAAEPA